MSQTPSSFLCILALFIVQPLAWPRGPCSGCVVGDYIEGPLLLLQYLFSFQIHDQSTGGELCFPQSFQKQYRKVLCSLFLQFSVMSHDGVTYLHQSLSLRGMSHICTQTYKPPIFRRRSNPYSRS